MREDFPGRDTMVLECGEIERNQSPPDIRDQPEDQPGPKSRRGIGHRDLPCSWRTAWRKRAESLRFQDSARLRQAVRLKSPPQHLVKVVAAVFALHAESPARVAAA